MPQSMPSWLQNVLASIGVSAITGLLFVGVAWGILSNRVDENTHGREDHEQRLRKVEGIVSFQQGSLAARLASIERELKHLREDAKKD